jgi:hypothetical protein
MEDYKAERLILEEPENLEFSKERRNSIATNADFYEDRPQ